jgi:hypothetical protein
MEEIELMLLEENNDEETVVLETEGGEEVLGLETEGGEEILSIEEELGIVGSSMTEIEVSTDIENPTDISQYFEQSGTYVAKNTGLIGFDEMITPIAKGGYFTVQNFKEDAAKFGVEISDEENVTMISLFYYDGSAFEEVLLKRIGIDDWSFGIKITSENVSDYLDLDIDVSSEVQQTLMGAVNTNYGMQLLSNRYLSFISASDSDIDLASNKYRVITPNNIKYAIQKWGTEYYASKGSVETLGADINSVATDVDNLKSEIETILESVVAVDE